MSYHNIRITGIPAPLASDYDRQVNFTDFEILNPGDPPRGVDLDAEFNAVQQALDETQDRLRLVQRDDGALANESVGLDQLKTEAKIGVNTPADWAPFTQYAVNDSVIVNDGAWYIALQSHVSSDDFDNDLLSGYWEELIDLTPYTVEARNWATYPEDQLVPEGNGTDEYSAFHYAQKADDSQVAAAASESAAATSESNAAASETAAAASESAAATSESNAAASEATALQALADFQGTYWGPYASEPATDPNGDPPNAGDLYTNTTDGFLYLYVSGAWRAITDYTPRSGPTASAVIPAGTEAQRDGTPQAGYLRFNADIGLFEGYNGSSWLPVGAGATGSAGDQVFVENDQTVTADYTIPATKNAMTTGPITVADGVTVTVSDGARWVVI